MSGEINILFSVRYAIHKISNWHTNWEWFSIPAYTVSYVESSGLSYKPLIHHDDQMYIEWNIATWAILVYVCRMPMTPHAKLIFIYFINHGNENKMFSKASIPQWRKHDKKKWIHELTKYGLISID